VTSQFGADTKHGFEADRDIPKRIEVMVLFGCDFGTESSVKN